MGPASESQLSNKCRDGYDQGDRNDVKVERSDLKSTVGGSTLNQRSLPDVRAFLIVTVVVLLYATSLQE